MSTATDFSVLPEPRKPSAIEQRLRGVPADGLDLRGLLHDVGHGLFTISLLLDAVPSGDRGRGDELLELLSAEVSRLLAAVHSGTRRSVEPVRIELRSLLEPFAVLARRTTATKVTVNAGPRVTVATDPAAMWRVVNNLVDNAIRAAGPAGRVEITLHRSPDAQFVFVDVTDDGPGFRKGPSGVAQLGLGVVNRLLDAIGGELVIGAVVPHGTRMRVVLPADAAVPDGPRAG